MNEVHYSSDRKDWGTPPEIFDPLDEIFGFTLDPCATPQNAKCERYYTADDDGLSKIWGPGEKVFMNPPYGNPEYPCKPNCKKKVCEVRGFHTDEYIPGIKDWVEKARESPALVVALLPARTDTSWWHDYVMEATEIWFLRGRIKFVGAEHPAPFPSAIVVFAHSKTGLHVRSIDPNHRG